MAVLGRLKGRYPMTVIKAAALTVEVCTILSDEMLCMSTALWKDIGGKR